MKNPPSKETPGIDGFTAECYKSFKEVLVLMLLKILHKIDREGMLPVSTNSILL
jgi:hypothetical protein